MPFTLVHEPERPLTLKDAREAAERHAIIEALTATQGNIDKAAEQLGLSHASIYRYLRKLRIIPADVVTDYRPCAAYWEECRRYPLLCTPCGRAFIHASSLARHRKSPRHAQQVGAA